MTVLKVIGVCCAGIFLAPGTQAASFTPLGDLPGGEFNSRAYDVSPDGRVVVGDSIVASGTEGFRWTPDFGMVGLGDLPGGYFGSRANAVSADGSVVVGQSYISDYAEKEAFRWTSESGMAGLGNLSGTFLDNYALDVSADGGVVVGGSDAYGGGAFRWTKETGIVRLGVIPEASGSITFRYSDALGVSADGNVVVGSSYGYFLSGNIVREAFRWTSEGGMVGLGSYPDGDVESDARDISADGRVVVGSAPRGSNSEAFRWTSETGMVGLGFLPGGFPTNRDTYAFGVSGDGSVIVGDGVTSTDGSREAFIWTQSHGIRKLEDVLVARGATGLEGWALRRANAVSDNGRWIVGWGTNPSGNVEAFLADTLIQFNDVPNDHWALVFIHKFADSQISRGCGDGNFCPEYLVTRAQMAVYLERGLNGHEYVPPPARGNVFTDVAADDFAASFIEKLFADGITGGCGGNKYCPGEPMTRAQIAVFLLRAKHGASYTPPPPSGDQFGDVDASHWAVAWIEELAAEGITGGCGGGNFCPNGSVTRAQMAVFMVRTFGL